MQRLDLEVSLREAGGKGPARRSRAQGNVPAVLYGSGVDSLPLSVEGQFLERVLRSGANALIDLKGAKEVAGKLVLIKEVQRDPLSQKLLHCDLYAVDLKKRTHVLVPIHIEGQAPGVELGGILNTLVRELEVSCLPLSIPENITVDVSQLQIGDSIRLADLTLPEDAEALAEETLAIVTVTAPRVEEEPEPEEGEVVEGEAPAEAPEGEAAAPAEEEKDKGGG